MYNVAKRDQVARARGNGTHVKPRPMHRMMWRAGGTIGSPDTQRLREARSWVRDATSPQRWWLRTLVTLLALGAQLAFTTQLLAQFSLSSSKRAADGTVYEVIVVPTGGLPGGAEAMRFTTVVGSVDSATSCSSAGGMSGAPARAVAGVDVLVGSVHPFANVYRTGVIQPSDVNDVTFSIGGSGRLTIGGIDVCLDASDCVGGSPDAKIYDLDGNLQFGSVEQASIPVACVRENATAGCSSAQFETYAFGLSRNDTTKECTAAPTTNTSICSPEPADGFRVPEGHAVVFIYWGGLTSTGFSIGAGGFGIDTDGTNSPGCSSDTVVTAAGQAQSAPPPPPPTHTPTPTSTPTPTATPTPTSVCGNGVVETNEDCDDGNLVSGDCCDSSCHFEPPSQSCDWDMNPCTIDHCDGAGSCVLDSYATSGTSCDADANVCTLDECDGSGGCGFVSNAPLGLVCGDDGLFCNGQEVCDGAGSCSAHSGNPCTTECNQTCNETNDSCFDPAGTACSEDGLVCTRDECDGAGACAHPARPDAECPKGYVLLEAPASATVQAIVGQSVEAVGASCTTSFEARRGGKLIGGDGIADLASGLAIRVRQSAEVMQECLTGGGTVTFSGIPPGTCTGGTDTSGTDVRLGQCTAAADRADVRRTSLLALPSGLSLGSVTVRTNQVLDVTGLGPVAVVDYGSLTVGHSKRLTILGNASTQAVLIRVSGTLRLRGWAEVLTQGIDPGPKGHPAERVLFLVEGSARIGANGQLEGSIFAQNGVRLGMNAQAWGAFVTNGGTLRTGRTSRLTHAPWVLW